MARSLRRKRYQARSGVLNQVVVVVRVIVGIGVEPHRLLARFADLVRILFGYAICALTDHRVVYRSSLVSVHHTHPLSLSAHLTTTIFFGARPLRFAVTLLMLILVLFGNFHLI